MAGPPHADASQVEAKIYVLSILHTSSILTDGWAWCNISAEDTYPRKCRIQHFLGFTFICGKSRQGFFLLKRKSRRDRMRAKLRAIKQELRRRMHQPIPVQGKWLGQVVNGYFNYHAVPTNGRALTAFRSYVIELWRRSLRRRGQRRPMTWEQITRLTHDWIPKPRILHPWPSKRFAVRHPRWEPYARIGPVRICAGGAQ